MFFLVDFYIIKYKGRFEKFYIFFYVCINKFFNVFKEFLFNYKKLLFLVSLGLEGVLLVCSGISLWEVFEIVGIVLWEVLEKWSIIVWGS